MKTISLFIKSTLLGGLLVLFPLFACIYVIVRNAEAWVEFTKPLMASVFILLVLCCLTGLVLRTSVGKALGLRVSRGFERVPGYAMFARLAQMIFDQEDQCGVPVIVQTGDSKQIGFMVEHHGPDELTVFLPSAPTPFSGNVMIVKTDKVEWLHVPAAKVARVMATFGSGCSEPVKDR